MDLRSPKKRQTKHETFIVKVKVNNDEIHSNVIFVVAI